MIHVHNFLHGRLNVIPKFVFLFVCFIVGFVHAIRRRFDHGSGSGTLEHTQANRSTFVAHSWNTANQVKSFHFPNVYKQLVPGF